MSAFAAGSPGGAFRSWLLDRDNPISVVHDRFNRLRIATGSSFRVWAAGAYQEPCAARFTFAPVVCKHWEPKPLIILDSLGGFMMATRYAAHMGHSPTGRHLSTSVPPWSVLHNDGKSETAKRLPRLRCIQDRWTLVGTCPIRKNGLLDRLTLALTRIGSASSARWTMTIQMDEW